MTLHHPATAEVRRAGPGDLQGWLELARELEPLFGPMVEDPAFLEGLGDVLRTGHAWCVPGGAKRLAGAIAIDPRENSIIWLGVGDRWRKRGYGRALLQCALKSLRPDRPVSVQTFAAGIGEGGPARALYRGFGFEDQQAAAPTPTGYATVVMVRPAIRR